MDSQDRYGGWISASRRWRNRRSLSWVASNFAGFFSF